MTPTTIITVIITIAVCAALHMWRVKKLQAQFDEAYAYAEAQVQCRINGAIQWYVRLMRNHGIELEPPYDDCACGPPPAA